MAYKVRHNAHTGRGADVDTVEADRFVDDGDWTKFYGHNDQNEEELVLALKRENILRIDRA